MLIAVWRLTLSLVYHLSSWFCSLWLNIYPGFRFHLLLFYCVDLFHVALLIYCYFLHYCFDYVSHVYACLVLCFCINMLSIFCICLFHLLLLQFIFMREIYHYSLLLEAISFKFHSDHYYLFKPLHYSSYSVSFNVFSSLYDTNMLLFILQFLMIWLLDPQVYRSTGCIFWF